MRQIPFLAVALAFLAFPAFAQEPKTLLEQGKWMGMESQESGGKICYMTSFPTASEGKYTKRGDVVAAITHRPAKSELNVVSLIMGYTIDDAAPVEVIIDKQSFKLTPTETTAWTDTAEEDAALVAAMRKGAEMVVKGRSAKGTPTTDTYSLSGFSAVNKAINKACGVK